MKKTFLSTTWMLSTATGLLLLMASCACTREDGNPVQTGSVSFPESEVTVPSEGGTASISYTAEDLAPDAELEFKSSDSWVHSFATGEDNTISFTVDANDSGSPRSAIVDVSVKGLRGSSSFAVMQAAPPDLQIILDSIGMNSVKGHTVAIDPDIRYAVMLLSEDNYNTLDRDNQRVFDTFLSDCNIIAEYNQMSLKEYLEMILISGEAPFEYTDLHPSTGYIIVAVGMDTEGSRTTDVFTGAFTTKDFSNNNITFRFEIKPLEGKPPDTDLIAYASDDTTRFIMNIFEKSEVEESGMSVEQWLQMKMDEYIGNGSMVGLPPQTIIDMNSKYGSGTVQMHDILKDRTAYIVAAAITDDGKINSTAGIHEFTTGVLDPSDNQIDLTISEIGHGEIIYSITTTNDDKYHVFLSRAKEFEGMENGDEILDHILSTYSIFAEATGNQKDVVKEGLTPGESYIMAVFGYHNGAQKATTGIDYEFFTLESEVGDASQLQFDIVVDEVTPFSAEWTVKAEPITALYYSGIFPAEMTEDEIKQNLLDEALLWIENGFVATVADYFRFVGYRGRSSIADENLAANTNYHIVTVGIFDSNGGFATEMIMTDVHTPKREVSGSKITVTHDKYFDGRELSEFYPEFSEAVGMAVLPLTAVTEGDIKNIYYYCFTGDYMDTEKYTDDYVISVLLTYGPAYEYTIFSAPYDTELTILAVAEDSNGNLSPVYREIFTLAQNRVSPADEFVMPEASTVYTIQIHLSPYINRNSK